MRRMSYPVRFFVFSLFTLSFSATKAQTDAGCKVPISRRLWHDNVDKAQAAAIRAGLTKGDNDDVVHFVNHALVQRVDALQCKIDKDSIGDQRKIGYLRGLERMIKAVTTDFRARKFTPS